MARGQQGAVTIAAVGLSKTLPMRTLLVAAAALATSACAATGRFDARTGTGFYSTAGAGSPTYRGLQPRYAPRGSYPASRSYAGAPASASATSSGGGNNPLQHLQISNSSAPPMQAQPGGRRLSGGEITSLVRGKTVHRRSAGTSPGELVEYFSPNDDRVWRGRFGGGVDRTRYAIQGNQLCYVLMQPGQCYDIRQSGDGNHVMSDRGGDRFVIVQSRSGDATQMAQHYEQAFPNAGQAPRRQFVHGDGTPVKPGDLPWLEPALKALTTYPSMTPPEGSACGPDYNEIECRRIQRDQGIK